MMFFFHISTRACFKKNVTAKRLCASWCLCVLAKPCISPVAVEGQALWSTESSLRVPRCLACVLHIFASSGQSVSTQTRHQKPTLGTWSMYLLVADFQLCIMFFDLILKLVEGDWESNVLEIQTEMAVLMSWVLSPNAYKFNICSQ